jgi:glycosyltransferase involved in cell wall biosynthesis
VKPLDLLFVGLLPPHPGGAAISAGQILTGLARRGHVIRAVAPITEDAARDGDSFARRHPALEIIRFTVPYFYVSPQTPAPEEYWRREEGEVERLLPALLRARRPDLIFVGRETYAACVAAIAARWRLPFVLRLPGGTTSGILRGQYPPALAARLLGAYGMAAAVISPGRHLADLVREHGVDRVTVIPTAADLEGFAPRPKDHALLQALEIPPGAVVIAHVSNLKPVKRPLDLVESAPAAIRRDGRLLYLIVGDGPLRGQMESECRDAGIQHRFRFVGWVDHAEMPAYFNLADMVVMPSEWEALARAYVETQACGRALVASDIRAAREVIVDGETGVLFRLGDVADLTDKILGLAGAPERRAALGRQARARSRPHALDGAVEAYERLLAELARPRLAATP